MEELNDNIVDYSGRGLTKVELIPCVLKTTTLIYDRNALSKLNGLDRCHSLQEFSAADNHIVRMNGVEKLTSLTVLNLPNNSILTIEGLSLLQNLVWLNLSGNSIKVIEGLVSNVNLQHLDVSDNCISTVSDISNLIQLQTVLVHGNSLSALSWACDYLPSSITVLSLADNNVDDLNEIASLSSLLHLEQLSVMNNPMTATLRGFDYRTYVLSWCDKLKVLDGQPVHVEERLKATSLYGQEFNTSEEQQVAETVESVLSQLTDYRTKVEENNKDSQEIFNKLLDTKEVYSVVDQATENTEIQHTEDLGVPEQASENTAVISRPRAAWGSLEGPLTLAVSPRPEEDIFHHSQHLQQFSTGDLCEKSSCDLLTSDSVYLAVSTPLRTLHPHATPTQTDTLPQPVSTSQKPADHQSAINSKVSAIEDHRKTTVLAARTALKTNKTRYDSYDKRPIRPLNQEKHSVTINKSQKRPLMQSKVESRAGERKLSHLPLSQNRTGGDISSPALRSQALSHIKDVAELRKNKRLAQHRPQSGNNLNSNVKAESYSTQPEGLSDKDKVDGSSKVGVEETWLGDSGFLSRPPSDAVPISDHENSAAVRIQCIWRGHWARHHCPHVRYVREEMRRRRMEEHILYLKADLQRQKLLYKEEKQLSNLQLEAIKHLWKEVQSLQSWRYEMVSDQPNISSQKHLNKEIENTMEKIEVIRGHGYHIPEIPSTNHTASHQSSGREDLEATCEHLKSQVAQLQETVQGFSSIISTSHYLTRAFQNPASDGCIRVRGCPEEACLNTGQSVNTKSHWGFTSRPPPEQNQVPYPGQPTPPSNLQLQHRRNNSVFLSWQPSKILDTSQQEVFQPLLGYRIYVNNTAIGMVPGNFTVAVAEFLDPSLTYRFYVQGVSCIGDSSESNSVIACVSNVTSTRLPLTEASSSDNSSDESDTENIQGKSPRSKNDQSSQRTKKKSPRREKERTQGTKIQTEKQEVSEESILSRKDSSSTDELPIYRYPRLHTPKSRSRIKSPDSMVSCDNDQVSSDCDTLLTTRPPTSGYSPKADDSRLKSGDLSLVPKNPKSPLSRDSSLKLVTGSDKAKLNVYSPSSTTNNSVPEPIVCWEETDKTIPDVTDGRLQTHGQTPLSPKFIKSAAVAKTEGSLTSQRQAPVVMLERGHSQPTITLSKPRPVLDGKKKPSEGTLKALDGSGKELSKSTINERRRTTVSDILEQQFASKQISASDGDVLKSSVCPPSQIRTVDTLKSFADDEFRRSKSENSSPTDKTQPGVGSDGETSAPFTIKSRTHGTSNVYQKLQTLSKAQEQSIRDSKKRLKLRTKSSSDTSLVVNEGEDNWPVRWRRISGGEDSEEETRGVLSDSAQCVTTATHTKVNKGHRRSSSMHGGGPIVVKDMSAVEGTYSPIMDGSKKKTSPSAGSSGVRRHASFNGILPSKGQDIRPTSEETAVKIKPMNKPAPTESSGQPTFRSRSPSPNASSRSGVHQPVLSAAQLQRLKSPAGIGQ